MEIKIHLKDFYEKEKQIMTFTNKRMELENSELIEVKYHVSSLICRH